MIDPPMPKRANENTPPARQIGPGGPAPPAPASGTVATDLPRSDANSMSGADDAAATGPAGADREIAPDATEVLIRIDSDRAITTAREHVRRLSTRAGFGPVDRALLATTCLGAWPQHPPVRRARRRARDVGRRCHAPGRRHHRLRRRAGHSRRRRRAARWLLHVWSSRPRTAGHQASVRRLHVSSSADEGTTVSVTKWRNRL